MRPAAFSKRPGVRFTTTLALAAIASFGIASASPDSTKAPCSAPEFRQFDFWIGNWEVRNPKGDLVGTNLVERILGDCVIQEHWKGKLGLEGSSFNIYDPSDGRWHQTWVDGRGTLLLLSGGLQDGKMVLTGDLASGKRPGTRAPQRITWEKLPDGRVRQHWQSSRKAAGPWEDVFLGLYSMKR